MQRFFTLLSVFLICSAPLPRLHAAAAPSSSKTSAPSPHAAAAGEAPATSPAESPPPSGGEIVPQLPQEIAEDLRKQSLEGPGADHNTISSTGSGAIQDGPQICTYAPECGKRQAIGFAMMTWGALLVGAIGLIVWLGLPGDQCHCDVCPES